jgi:hypothetical protein
MPSTPFLRDNYTNRICERIIFVLGISCRLELEKEVTAETQPEGK